MQSSAEGFFLNNVVVLVALFIALVLFHLAIIQYVKRKALKKGRPWNGPPNAIAFPCWEVSVLLVCYQSICQSCVVVMRISQCPGYFWGALTILVIFAGGFLGWALHFTYTRIHKQRVPGLKWTAFTKADRIAACQMLSMVRKEKTFKDKFRRLQLAQTKIKDSWLNAGEWTGNAKFTSMYGSLFDDFRESAFYGAVWMELARKLLMAVCLGMLSPDASLAQVISTLCVVGMSFCFTLLARPYAKFSKNVSYLVVNSAQTGMFLLMLLTMLDPVGDMDFLSGMLMNLNLGSVGYNSFFSMAGIIITVTTFIANLGKMFAQAQVAYRGFKDQIAPIIGQMQVATAGGAGQQILMVALIAKEVLSALADLDRVVGEVLMETMDSFEGAATDSLQAGALALGATSIAAAAKDITKQKRSNITEQDKYFKADGMDKLMGAAKKQAVADLRTKKPVLTAEQRLEQMESIEVVPMPAGRKELKKLETMQLASRIENAAAKGDQLSAVLNSEQLVSGPLEEALMIEPGTAEVLNAGDSSAAAAMLQARSLAVLGYADATEAKAQAAHALLAQIRAEGTGMAGAAVADEASIVDQVLPSYAEYEQQAISSALEVLLEEDENWKGEEIEPTREKLMEVMTNVTTQKTKEAVEEKTAEALEKKLGSGGMGMQELVVSKVMKSIRPKIQLLTARKLARMYQLTHDAYLEFSQHVLPSKTSMSAAAGASRFAGKLKKRMSPGQGTAPDGDAAASGTASLAGAVASNANAGGRFGDEDEGGGALSVPIGSKDSSGEHVNTGRETNSYDAAALDAPAHRTAPLLEMLPDTASAETLGPAGTQHPFLVSLTSPQGEVAAISHSH